MDKERWRLSTYLFETQLDILNNCWSFNWSYLNNFWKVINLRYSLVLGNLARTLVHRLQWHDDMLCCLDNAHNCCHIPLHNIHQNILNNWLSVFDHVTNIDMCLTNQNNNRHQPNQYKEFRKNVCTRKQFKVKKKRTCSKIISGSLVE